MIDTYSRDPQQSLRDVTSLVQRCTEAGLVPLEWRIGFFVARDIVRLEHDARRVRFDRAAPWTPLLEIAGLPAFVVELEDRIQLVAAPPDGRGYVRLVERKFLTIDRRASGD